MPKGSPDEMNERITSLESEIRSLREEMDAARKPLDMKPADAPGGPIPVFRVATDENIGHELNRGNLLLWLNTDALTQRFPALAGGGGGGVVPQCNDLWYTYRTRCVTRPGLSPLILDFQRNIQTCNERVDTWDFCCVTCPGGGSSGSEMEGLDRWAGPCDDGGSNGTNYIYLSSEVYDGFVAGGTADPIIQINGGGLCYKLDARGVTAVMEVPTAITLFSTCADTDCETPAPCDWASPPASITLANPGSLLGTVGNFNGASCDNCTDAGQPESASIVWNTFDVSGDEQRLLMGSATYIQTSPGRIVGLSSRIGLNTADCFWFIAFQFACPSTVSIYYIKQFGETASGTYTLAPFGAAAYQNTAALEACSTLTPTITVP